MNFICKYWSVIRSGFQVKQLSFATLLLLLFCVTLQFVFSLPHVIALRKLLLLVAFFIALKYFFWVLLNEKKPLLKVFVIFVMLQVWMLVITGFVSDQPSNSFSEWKGQWLPTVMSFVIGIGLSGALMQTRLKEPRAMILLSILIPITLFLLINLIVIINYWISAGRFIPSLGGIGDHHGVSNYLTALLEPILFVDIYGRLVTGKRLLPVSNLMISVVLVIVVCTLVATTDRNGILAMLIALIAIAAMISVEIRRFYSLKRISALAAAISIFMLTTAVVSYKIDPRWQNFIETMPVAWDIDSNLVWLKDDGSNLPSTPSGGKVDTSEYYRIAWAHEGWRMLIEHPWGTEISRSVFQKLVMEKYGYTTIPHSHNSWIDFGLQVGIPGLALWGWFLMSMVRFGWHIWRKDNEPLGMVLSVLIILLAIRGLMDSIFRDHEIEQFMLVVGLLFGALIVQSNRHPRELAFYSDKRLKAKP